LQYEAIVPDFVQKLPKLLLAARLGFPEDPSIVPPLESVPILQHVNGDAAKLPQFTVVESQPKEELRLAPSVAIGFTNLVGGPGITRKVPLLYNYRGEIVPSFALQAAILWFKLTPDDVKVDLGSRISLGDALRIPIDAAGNMSVDVRAPVTRIAFDDLVVAAQE